MTSHLCIVRHGYATKTRDNRQGGHGILLEEGVLEIEKASQRISDFYHPIGQFKTRVFSPSQLQVMSSARILAESMGTIVIVDSRIQPLNLGVLSGLTLKESMQRYPLAAVQMEEWRHGKREIMTLKIPGLESPENLWQRCKDFLEGVQIDATLNIVVGTRSVITCLVNMLLGNSIKIGGGYRPISIQTGGIAAFKEDDNHWSVTSKHLWDVKLL